VHEIIGKASTEAPESIRAVEPDTPPELAAICERAMQADPTKRYQTAKQLADEVQRFLSGALVQAYEYRFTEHLKRFVSRNWPVLATAALGLVLLVGVAILSYVRVVREQQKTARELYGATINVAQHRIEDSRFSEVKTMLASCPPEYRHWEWGRLAYLTSLDSMTFVHPNPGSGPYIYVDFSPAGDLVASGGGGTVRMWDLESGEQVFFSDAFTGKMVNVLFSPDGKLLATGDESTIRLWDVEEGTLARAFEAHTQMITALAFTPDSTRLASGSYDGALKLWDVASGEISGRLPDHPGEVNCVAISPDGQFIATTCHDELTRVWEIDTWRAVIRADQKVAGDERVRFPDDGKTLVTSLWDGRVCLWNRETGKRLKTIRVHSSSLHSLALSPDGIHFATASRDKTVRVTNKKTGRVLVTFPGHSDVVSDVAFGPFGRRIASGSPAEAMTEPSRSGISQAIKAAHPRVSTQRRT
jgi:WD40 repeat protein